MKGPGEFQSIWQEISAAFGIIIRREARKRPEKAKEIKYMLIVDAKDKLESAAVRLHQLIGRTSTLHGSMQLDITLGSMSGVTAGCVYDTLLSGVQFVIDCFKYIGQEELLNRISMSQLPDKLVEGSSV